jgi:hypothetical protein
MEGRGFLFLKDGKVFTGTFKNDKPEGPGQLLYDGSRTLEHEGAHEDLISSISHSIFVIGSGAQRYKFQVPLNKHIHNSTLNNSNGDASKKSTNTMNFGDNKLQDIDSNRS